MNDEKKAIEVLKHCKGKGFSAFDKIYFDDGTNMCVFQAMEILLKVIEKIKEIVDIYNNTKGEEICLSDNEPIIAYLQELFKEEN